MNFDIGHVRAALPDRRVDYYDLIDSTMTAAAAIHEPGAIVVANQQTAGQGRHGHRWHSEPGSGLYFTIVLTPQLPADLLPVVTLALGVTIYLVNPWRPEDWLAIAVSAVGGVAVAEGLLILAAGERFLHFARALIGRAGRAWAGFGALLGIAAIIVGISRLHTF